MRQVPRPTPSVAFLGPLGTFTEQALLTQPDLGGAHLVPRSSIPEVLDAVTNGEVDFGFVAIENSIEGTVNLTQDALCAFNTRVQPVLMNACANCHTTGKGGSFKLTRAAADSPLTSRSRPDLTSRLSESSSVSSGL